MGYGKATLSEIREVLSSLYNIVRLLYPTRHAKNILDYLLKRTVGVTIDSLIKNSIYIYLLYRAGRRIFFTFVKGGIDKVLSYQTALSLGILVLISTGIWRYKRAKRRRRDVVRQNDVIEGTGEIAGALSLSSTPLETKTPPSKYPPELSWVITQGKRVWSCARRVYQAVGRGLSPFTRAINTAGGALKPKFLTLLLAFDVGLTLVERHIFGLSPKPRETPKPLRKRWEMEEPDEVQYDLLNREF